MATLARWQATIVDEAGNVQAGASVRVQRDTPGLPLVPIYSDRQGTAQIANPATADADGFIGFHVAGGAYRITATKGAFSREWTYVAIGTAGEADIDDLSGDITFSGFTPDAVVDTLAERDAYDTQARGFSVLVTGNGVSPPEDPLVYFLTDPNTSPVTWSSGVRFNGADGQDGAAGIFAQRIVTAAGAITMLTSDDIILVNKTVGAATTVNLVSAVGRNRPVIIKDLKGDAATNNITIVPDGIETIDIADPVIRFDRGSLALYPLDDGSGWFAS